MLLCFYAKNILRQNPLLRRFLSDIARLDQVNIIITACSESLSKSFHPRLWSKRKGKYPALKKCDNSHQLIKHTKISCLIALFTYHRFVCLSYWRDLHRGTWKLRYSNCPKLVVSTHFAWNSNFSIFVERVWYLKT